MLRSRQIARMSPRRPRAEAVTVGPNTHRNRVVGRHDTSPASEDLPPASENDLDLVRLGEDHAEAGLTGQRWDALLEVAIRGVVDGMVKVYGEHGVFGGDVQIGRRRQPSRQQLQRLARPGGPVTARAHGALRGRWPRRARLLRAQWPTTAAQQCQQARRMGAGAGGTPGTSTRDLMEGMGHGTMRAALIYQHAARDAGRRIADSLEAEIERRQSHVRRTADDTTPRRSGRKPGMTPRRPGIPGSSGKLVGVRGCSSMTEHQLPCRSTALRRSIPSSNGPQVARPRSHRGPAPLLAAHFGDRRAAAD